MVVVYGAANCSKVLKDLNMDEMFMDNWTIMVRQSAQAKCKNLITHLIVGLLIHSR